MCGVTTATQTCQKAPRLHTARLREVIVLSSPSFTRRLQSKAIKRTVRAVHAAPPSWFVQWPVRFTQTTRQSALAATRMAEFEAHGWRWFRPSGAPAALDPDLVGKWMVFAGEKSWRKVVAAMADGRITAPEAKTVPLGCDTGSAPLIAVYTRDYTDLYDVLRVGLQLQRELGLFGKTMAYKLDEQTHARVYGGGASFYQLRGSSLVSTQTQQTLLEARDLPDVDLLGQQGHGAAVQEQGPTAQTHQQQSPGPAPQVAAAAAAAAASAAAAAGTQHSLEAEAARSAAARRLAGEAAAARAAAQAQTAAQPPGQAYPATSTEQLADVVIDLTED